MTHISRPFQIALAAAVLLAGVWFFALRSTSPSGESSGGSSSSSAPASSSGSSSAASSQSAPGGGTKTSAGKTYHGSAPGVAGLTHAIAKAQGAVKQSEQNARQLQQKAAQATGQTQTQQSQAQTQQRSTATQTQQDHGATRPSSATHAKSAPQPRTQAPGVAAKPTKQALVESELKHGDTVIVLFWNRKGSVDVAVRRQLSSLRGRNVVVHYSSAAEVGQYGEITRSLQVLQTPTMLVIDANGNTKTLTGLVDTYAIRQAIAEARTSK